MSQESIGVQDSIEPLKEEQKCQHILQFLLECRGICHENTLLLVEKKLQERQMNRAENLNCSFNERQARLNTIINKINVTLSPLNYKIVRINHGIGKRCVSTRGATQITEFPDSNRFFVYVNDKCSDEVKLATRFSHREIEFVKWSLEQFILAGSKTITGTIQDSWGLTGEVDRIRREVGGSDFPSWGKYCSFTIGSIEISKYDQMNALEIEELNDKLCQLKWFYKNDVGEIGIDVRAIAELENNLVESFELVRCPVCNSLALQGVMITTEQGSSYWHLDCYQHYITHISKEYLGTSLITQGVYVI